MNPGTEKAAIVFDPQKTDIRNINQVLEPLGYSLSDTETFETPRIEDDHSMHNESHESLESERAKIQFILPITLLVF